MKRLWLLILSVTCCGPANGQIDRHVAFVAQIRNVMVENDIGFCSGVILATGRVLTAAHCNNGPNLMVDKDKAKVIKEDAGLDLLLLSAPTVALPDLEIGETPQAGDLVFSCGNILELINLITPGYVAFVDEKHVLTHGTMDVPGMSGSALYDTKGRLIGINNQYRLAPFNSTKYDKKGNPNGHEVHPTPVLASAIPPDVIRAFLKGQ